MSDLGWEVPGSRDSIHMDPSRLHRTGGRSLVEKGAGCRPGKVSHNCENCRDGFWVIILIKMVKVSQMLY